MKKILLLILSFELISCATRKVPAPIINVTSVSKYIKQQNNNSNMRIKKKRLKKLKRITARKKWESFKKIKK